MKSFVSAVLCCLLASCAAPAPPSSTPVAVVTPGSAVVSIGASGQVSCPNYGCRASIVIRPDPSGASPPLTLTVGPAEEIVFPTIPHGGPCLCIWDVGARELQLTRSLMPGRYFVVGLVDEISDTIDLDPTPPGGSPAPFDVFPQCFTTFDVAGGGSVSLTVRFKAEAPCSIKAASNG